MAGIKPYDSMSAEEQAWLRAQFALAGTGRLIEYGAGYSTLWALDTAISHIRTVDGNLEYVNGWLLKQAPIEAAGGRVTVWYTPDLGASHKSEPDEKYRDYGLRYSAMPLDGSYDLAFVDGRFRVACILACLVHGVPKIIVHDWSNRPHYSEVLRFCTAELGPGSFATLTPKPDFTPGEIRAMLYEVAIFDPR